MFKLIEWDTQSQAYTGVRDQHGLPVCSFSIHDMLAAKAEKPHAWIYDCETEAVVDDTDCAPESCVRKKAG